MRSFLMAASAALLMGAPVYAQGLSVPTNILFSKDVEKVPMAEWEIEQRGAAEQTGARILIAAGNGEVARAPANATRYESQAFKFPSGTFRVLSFTKKNGGVLHQITTETQLYVVKGSAMVDVRGVPTEIRAGDVVNFPSGVMRNAKKKSEDTVVLAMTVGNTAKDSKAVVVRGKDTPDTPIPPGPKGGIEGAKVSVQRYSFEGNSIRVARLKAPGKTSPVTPQVDALIYLLSGRMQITVGDETKIVSAGDALREEAGKPTYWEVLENSAFVATNGPTAKP